MSRSNERKVKCVVWDLDNTLWEGTLLEDKEVTVSPRVREIVHSLDQRGILQSVASKNDYEHAINRLKELGLDSFFIYPQIHWNPKSSSIENIAESLNIGLDSIAFIDDQPFEREEVRFKYPEVFCIDSSELNGILDMHAMNPRFITEDSQLRRIMYLQDMERKKVEEEFEGTQEEFLATLNMVFTISPVREGDLERAEELTVRTHQMNTTGYTYSYEELNYFRYSPNHKLFIASLEDKYGNYGKIGLMLIECTENAWTVKLLLMSCRVMSRGVGSIFINYISKLAQESNVSLRAEYVDNGRNRMMQVTYMFNGFKEIQKKDGGCAVLECNLEKLQPFPPYITVKFE